ncbi:hypothetical protein [Pseudocnuella soli]|uniref:hypothetical protein n=1 Tax=Pseudocnuella soli TaxID=2502779 RepID=UPI00104ADF6C|nr:hypothetical protein [Pseudocnuella soli]
MELEITERVLQEIAQELKEQKEQLALLRQAVGEQYKVIQGIEEMLAKLHLAPSGILENGISLIKDALTKNFKALREDMFRRPTINVTHQHHSLMPDSFRMEHFPLLVNTIMKWVIALISLVFTIWLIAGMVKG